MACGRNGAPVGWLENAVLPVGCPPTDPKSESENVEPVAVDVVALVGAEAAAPGPKLVSDVVSCGTGGLPELPERKEDATLVKVVAGAPVCWGWTCVGLWDGDWFSPAPFASSKSVGARGTGGGDGALGTPNGLREPVWCGLRGFSDGEGFVWVRGVEAGRAGTEDGVVALNVYVGAGAVVLERSGEVG